MDIRKVGIVGAGIMGCGVAQNFAMNQYQVSLIDLTEDRLQLARERINQNIRLYNLVNSNMDVINSEELFDRIKFSINYDILKESDYVIENVIENFEEKRKVYLKIDKLCHEECIFSANTSVIPIIKLASFTNRKDKVIGIHFMNPAPLKNTVEIIKSVHTSENTLTVTKNLLSSINKNGIVVSDSPGFVSNRILMLTINEAIYLLQDKVSTVQDIDRIFKECFGHKSGPLETADMIGLDTILLSIENLYNEFNDNKYVPCPLLKKMVNSGFLGCKSGKGFYEY